MTNSFLNFIIDLLKNSNKILKRRANDVGTDERKGDDSANSRFYDCNNPYHS